MLRIYDVMLEVLREVRPLMEQIGRHDRSLEDQMRRAAASVALNIAEASGSRGKSRGLRYSTALGSARETRACLQVAHALGYVTCVDGPVFDRLDHVVATLVKVIRVG